MAGLVGMRAVATGVNRDKLLKLLIDSGRLPARLARQWHAASEHVLSLREGERPGLADEAAGIYERADL